MAKTSQVARQKKRERLVEKYNQKRKDFKEKGDFESLSSLPKLAGGQNRTPHSSDGAAILGGR